MYRYFALLWDPDDRRSVSCVAAFESHIRQLSTPWTVSYRNHGALVAYHPSERHPVNIYSLCDREGVIVGCLFPRIAAVGDTTTNFQLNAYEARRILNSAGRHLVEHYWGSYVAILRDDQTGSCGILRDPTATLACYHAAWDNVHIFFSDMDDFSRFVRMPLSFNWPHIAAHLLTGGHLSRECGLLEIEDVPGGELVMPLRQTNKRTTLWCPATFCVEDGLQDERKAAHALRSTVANVVHTLASQHSSILLRLSGGLDSSIIAACLGQRAGSAQVTCLNFFVSREDRDESNGPLPQGLSKEAISKMRRLISSADEREFARTVAQTYGFNLIEMEKRVAAWNFSQLLSAPLAPRPSNYAYVLDEDAAESEHAIAREATACFTGGAGDTVFYATFRAIAALDYAFLHPLGSRLLRHIAETAALSGESMARIMAKVIRYGYLRGSLPLAFDPMKQPHLLRDDVATSVSSASPRHPWVDSAARLCPGKLNQVHGVAASVPAYHRVYHRERIAVSIHPLASQPIVETCLRIPTYVLLAGGVSRGLTRRAFRDILPAKVVRRTTKGVAIAFWQRLLRHHMKFIRDFLLDGILVKERLLDRRKLETYMLAEQPFLTVHPKQIMDYLACEAWLRQWNSR